MAGGDVEQRVRAAIRAHRKALRLTQGQLTERLRRHLPPDRQGWAIQSNISKYEKNDLGADLTLHAAIAAAVGTTLDALVQGAPRAPKAPAAPVDPLIQAVAETLATGRVEPVFLWAGLNAARLQAGLPAITPPRARTHARRA